MTPTMTQKRTDATKAVAAAKLFHALSDDIRVAALQMLRGGEKCVCELQDGLDVAQSRLSWHLKVLKDAGVVTDRREGRWSYYTIVPDDADVVRELATSASSGAGASPARKGLRVLGDCCG